MKKIHYAWAICFACMLMLFCTIGLNTTTISVHLPYIRDNFGFSNTQTSSLISIRMFASIFGLWFVDRLLRLTSPRGCAVTGLLCMTAGHLLFALASAYWMFVAGAVINGLAYGFGSMVVAALFIEKWFNKSRGLALSICSAGSGLCSVIMSPAATWIMERRGLQASFFAEALFLAAVTLTIFLILRNTPEETGRVPYDAEITEVKAELPEGAAGIGPALTVLLCFGTVLLGYEANGLSGQTANLYVTAGFDPLVVSAMLSAFGLFMFTGKILFGQFADKHGGLKSNVLFMCFAVVGCSINCLANLHSVPLAFAGVCIGALGIPTSTIGITLNSQNLYTRDKFVRMQKILQMMFCFGGVFSGVVAGAIADATGSFVLMEVLMVAAAAAYLLINIVSYKNIKKL